MTRVQPGQVLALAEPGTAGVEAWDSPPPGSVSPHMYDYFHVSLQIRHALKSMSSVMIEARCQPGGCVRSLANLVIWPNHRGLAPARVPEYFPAGRPRRATRSSLATKSCSRGREARYSGHPACC